MIGYNTEMSPGDNRLSRNVKHIRGSHIVHHKGMKYWIVKSSAEGKLLSEVQIRGGIFQRDTISQLSFVIAMMPLNVHT